MISGIYCCLSSREWTNDLASGEHVAVYANAGPQHSLSTHNRVELAGVSGL